MTLMNRLFGSWTAQPFAALKCQMPGLDRLRFLDLLEGLGPDLYDRRTGRGWILVYNPGQLDSLSSIQYLALGPTWDEAVRRANVEVPERLRRLARSWRDPVGGIIDSVAGEAPDRKNADPGFLSPYDSRARSDLAQSHWPITLRTSRRSTSRHPDQ